MSMYFSTLQRIIAPRLSSETDPWVSPKKAFEDNKGNSALLPALSCDSEVVMKDDRLTIRAEVDLGSLACFWGSYETGKSSS